MKFKSTVLRRKRVLILNVKEQIQYMKWRIPVLKLKNDVRKRIEWIINQKNWGQVRSVCLKELTTHERITKCL